MGHDFPASVQTRILRECQALWHLAWPILIGQLASLGMSVTDIAMAGHASAQDLAGVGLGASVWGIIVVTLMGVVMAVNPVIAHQVGAKEFDKIPHVVRQALWSALGVGLVALALAELAALVFDQMALEPAVRDVAKRFVRITGLAMPAFALYRVLYGYSTNLNQTKPMMVIALIALLLNGLLDWLLVFGQFGLPRLGGLGCAVATAICVWFNLLALWWWMRRAPAYRSTWPLAHYEAPHWPMVRRLLRLGAPIGLTFFAETSAFGLVALLVARFGSYQIGAHQIALNFASLMFMLPLSMGMGLLTRVGQALGAGAPALARFRAWVGVGMALAFALLAAACMALMNQQIAAAYTSDLQVAQLAADLLFLAAVFQVSDSTQVVASSAIRGYKVTRAPMLIHLTAFWGFSLPLGCLLGLAPQWIAFAPATPMAAQGFWIALAVGLTVAAVGLVGLLQQISQRAVLEQRGQVA